jgi:hypothetical protein
MATPIGLEDQLLSIVAQSFMVEIAASDSQLKSFSRLPFAVTLNLV